MRSVLARSGWRRWARGALSAMASLFFVVNGLGTGGLGRLTGPRRLRRGLVLVLPGIDGLGPLNASIAYGLSDGGVREAIEVYDWTTGRIWWLFWHLRSRELHERSVRALLARIRDYWSRYPGRPVTLIGYSGGAGIALQSLEQMRDTESVRMTVLLAAAVSRGYDLSTARSHCRRGLWSFWSVLDVPLAVLMLLLGTFDGRHDLSAGVAGFRRRTGEGAGEEGVVSCPWTPSAMRNFYFGGHLGIANRVFVSERIAPLIRAEASRELASGEAGTGAAFPG